MVALAARDGALADTAVASTFYQPLLDIVFGGGQDPADVTVLADPLMLPESSTPATRPVSLDYMLAGVVH